MNKTIPLILLFVGFQISSGKAADKVDFEKSVRPLLEEACIRCHGAEKQKGRLRLDSKVHAIKADADDSVIIPGKAEESELYKRIILPAGHDDIMPNEGDPLSKAQTDLIRDWINQGAFWPDGLAIGPQETKEKGKEIGPGPEPTEAELQAIAKLQEMGVSARPIAMNMNWREANYYLLGTNITDAALAPLKNIPSLMQLNLGGTAISDNGLANISGLTNLTRLHLEKTSVSDSGLAHLKDLANLTYLNLYGTSVSDQGLKHLSGLTNLKNIYLWQTQVTDAGAKALQDALPELEISRGWDLTVVAKADEEKEADKEKEKEKNNP